MEWKRKLHREAREKGHRLSPIVRRKSIADKDSLIPIKNLPLKSRKNEYNAACSRCSMPVHAITYPGQDVQISFPRAGKKFYEMPLCGAGKRQSNDATE